MSEYKILGERDDADSAFQEGDVHMSDDPPEVQGEPENGHAEIVQGHSLSKRMKLIKTSCMMLTFVAMGSWTNIISPTSVDMSELYDTSIKTFIQAASLKSLGILVGSFLGAFVADKFRSKADLGLFLSTLFGGLSIASVPFSPSIITMSSLFFVNGICHGILNNVCCTIIINEWGESAPTPLHALRMFLTIGTILTPPMTIPFLSATSSNSTNALEQHVEYMHDRNQTSYTGHVEIAYIISGAWAVPASLLFFIMTIHGVPYSTTTPGSTKKFKDIVNPALLARGSLKYGLYFLLSLFLLYVLLHGRDRGIIVFLFVIAHVDVGMSKPLAALLVMFYGISVTVSRAVGALITRWIPIQVILFIEVVVAIILQLLFYLYGVKTNVILWILSVCYGLASGATFPSMMSWANRYIEATGIVFAVIDFGNGIGGFLALWFYGLVHDDYGSNGVFILGFINGVLILLLLIPLQIASCIHGDRHTNIAEQSKSDMTSSNIQICAETDDVLEDHSPIQVQ